MVPARIMHQPTQGHGVAADPDDVPGGVGDAGHRLHPGGLRHLLEVPHSYLFTGPVLRAGLRLAGGPLRPPPRPTGLRAGGLRFGSGLSSLPLIWRSCELARLVSLAARSVAA